QPEVRGLVEVERVGEGTRRLDRRDDGATALLGRFLCDPLPTPGAIPPAAGLERDDGPRRQHRDDARYAELGRGAHDRFHLVALGDRLMRVMRSGDSWSFAPTSSTVPVASSPIVSSRT